MFLFYFQVIVSIYKGQDIISQEKNRRNGDVKFYIPLKISTVPRHRFTRLGRIDDFPTINLSSITKASLTSIIVI